MIHSSETCFSQRHKKITRHSLARLTQIMQTRLFAAAIISLILDVKALSVSRDDHWYFTAAEVEAAYQYQENYGGRIRHPLRAKECLLGRKEFLAAYRGKEFLAPCRFINDTTSKRNAQCWRSQISLSARCRSRPSRRSRRSVGEKIPQTGPGSDTVCALREPTLVALYHTAEHLKVSDPKTGHVNAKAKEWKEKRNVLGFFDGRPIQILPPHPMGFGVGMPPQYESYGGFNFLASHRGELFLFIKNKAITFDVSLENDHEVESPSLARDFTPTNP